MTTQNKIVIGLGTSFLLLTILFVGQYYDPQDGDRTIFIKHRPIIKQYFYSPVAYHKLHPTQLTSTEEMEEKAFHEFITDRHLLTTQTNSLPLSISFFQLSMTLLVCGFFSLITKHLINYWQLLIQYLINVFLTFLGSIHILLDDSPATTLTVLLLLLSSNIFTIVLLTRIQTKAHPHSCFPGQHGNSGDDGFDGTVKITIQ